MRLAAFESIGWGSSVKGADPNFPCDMMALSGAGSYVLDPDATHYIFMQSGGAELRNGTGKYVLGMGMYAQQPGLATVDLGYRSHVLVATRHQHRGVFMLGGPVEWQGRMRYIDGCTDSLLVPPTMLGDPCLNLLYFPSGINQTMHTHPSVRLGTIISGNGWCRYDSGLDRDGAPVIEEVALVPGMAFRIRPEGIHAFRTEGSSMRVMAWHPDSDFGPTHEAHPMLNRTIIDGLSAAHPDRAAFRTKGGV